MEKFNYQGHNVHYEIHGEGKPLLILNGIMMSTKSWHQFLPILAKNNKIILLDFIDQGQTDNSRIENYDYSFQTELVKEFLSFLNISKIDMFGISYGGQVALDFSSTYPNLIDKLIIFNTSSKVNFWMKEVFDLWLDAGRTKNSLAYYKATIPTIYSQSFFNNNIDWMKEREAILLPLFGDEVFLNRMERLVLSTYNLDIDYKINKITATTLIVASLEDFLTPLKMQEFLNENIKNSDLVVLPNTGHATMYERPLVFTSLVLGFINS